MRIRIYLITLFVAMVLSSCSSQRQEGKLRIGIIQPSINHLPLSYALSMESKVSQMISLHRFNSGWEVQEALIGGKIDAAIMPFSYAYNAAAKGYPIRIASFLERETDAIVTRADCMDIKDLDGKKMGLLKASTVDLLARQLADSLGISIVPVFFRSPNEMISALQRYEVDAITIYEPIISKLDQSFGALYYFGQDYPMHPCCDMVINTQNMSSHKQKVFDKCMHLVELGIDQLESPEGIQFVMESYGLSEEAALNALAHTGFATGLDIEGQSFEQMVMQRSVNLGYTDKVPKSEDIYYK